MIWLFTQVDCREDHRRLLSGKKRERESKFPNKLVAVKPARRLSVSGRESIALAKTVRDVKLQTGGWAGVVWVGGRVLVGWGAHHEQVGQAARQIVPVESLCCGCLLLPSPPSCSK